ncbi:L-serine dehydratase [Alteribacillus persepolensis]|uniref:L-serine ammonia-lyase n=1 Tax=Alteribacillus persepolensis TaxID=568899 RepID=A0A1G8GWI3_9BACI|nr:serine dehydratase beta chain [Alteribacillus persepolensis]SDH98747.1 L-serine dehydratase [Alteribacillus persepolensis]
MEFRSCFDIIGPVMVGPSSSHTAGVVSIGTFIYEWLRGSPERADIIFYHSFAETYQGHGTEKALLGGLLGMDMADLQVKQAIEIAEQEGVHYTLQFEESCPYYDHPNTVVVRARRKKHVVTAGGVSLGGGLSKIFMLNGEMVDIYLRTSDDISKVAAQYCRDEERAMEGGV